MLVQNRIALCLSLEVLFMLLCCFLKAMVAFMLYKKSFRAVVCHNERASGLYTKCTTQENLQGLIFWMSKKEEANCMRNQVLCAFFPSGEKLVG